MSEPHRTIEVIRSIISREFCIGGQILSYNAIISHNFILIVFYHTTYLSNWTDILFSHF